MIAGSTVAAQADEFSWYRCIVKASSHTGYYTFKIATNPCRIYWREIDTWLKIRDCELPVIVAFKPSDTDGTGIVWFHMGNGRFYDNLSGVKDRGICTVMAGVPKG
jgi:hypothetical protein